MGGRDRPQPSFDPNVRDCCPCTLLAHQCIRRATCQLQHPVGTRRINRSALIFYICYYLYRLVREIFLLTPGGVCQCFGIYFDSNSCRLYRQIYQQWSQSKAWRDGQREESRPITTFERNDVNSPRLNMIRNLEASTTIIKSMSSLNTCAGSPTSLLPATPPHTTSSIKPKSRCYLRVSTLSDLTFPEENAA